MKIKSREELSFYLMADRMMNRGVFRPSLKNRLTSFITPDYMMQWLSAMRHVSYYGQLRDGVNLPYICWLIKYRRLSMKLGLSISVDVFGYGLVIPHYGTIVVGAKPRIGNYAVLHTSTCISDNGKVIGDGLYLSTGAKITSEITLGNNISIGANSVVNKSFLDNNALIAGMPARYIEEKDAWYMEDSKYLWRHQQVEQLKLRMKF